MDEALRAFYALPDAGEAARWYALRDIVRACEAYVSHKPEGGRRVAGVERLKGEAEGAQAELDASAVFRGLLTEVDRMVTANEDPDMDVRLPAGEAQKASQKMSGPAFTTLVDGLIRDLGELRGNEGLPGETRAVIDELMAVVGLVTVKQYPRGGMPGMKLTSAADQDPAFTFNVDTQARGGTSFMLGHVAHELTHVAAHQAFGSSPVMELVRAGATDAQVTALAEERRDAIAGLRRALGGGTGFSDFQQRMLEEKLVYGGAGGKLKKYADSFAAAGKITPEQQAQLIAWDAAAGPASGTLVEYDTVINQMLVYLHLWETEPEPSLLRGAAGGGTGRVRPPEPGTGSHRAGGGKQPLRGVSRRAGRAQPVTRNVPEAVASAPVPSEGVAVSLQVWPPAAAASAVPAACAVTGSAVESPRPAPPRSPPLPRSVRYGGCGCSCTGCPQLAHQAATPPRTMITHIAALLCR